MGSNGDHGSNLAGSYTHHFRLLGANGADPTTEVGAAHATVTRTGEGAYRITWDENPGEFMCWHYGFGAATPADCAGYTAVRDTYDATNLRLDFVVYSSTFAAADIIANQYIDVFVVFADNTVN